MSYLSALLPGMDTDVTSRSRRSQALRRVCPPSPARAPSNGAPPTTSDRHRPLDCRPTAFIASRERLRRGKATSSPRVGRAGARRAYIARWQDSGNFPAAARIIEITCPRWRRARHEGLAVHETRKLELADMCVVDGIPSTTVERTIFDEAAVCSRVVIDLAIDNSLRRELRLSRRCTRCSNVSLGEAERAPACYERYVVRDARGNFVARPDWAYPEAKLAIEYDSYQGVGSWVGATARLRDDRDRLVATRRYRPRPSHRVRSARRPDTGHAPTPYPRTPYPRTGVARQL